MKYTFKVVIQGNIELIEEIETDIELAGCPFGYTKFRTNGTSECDQTTIDKFWDIIETIMINNNKDVSEFQRVVSAIDTYGKSYGEGAFSENSVQLDPIQIDELHSPPEEWL